MAAHPAAARLDIASPNHYFMPLFVTGQGSPGWLNQPTKDLIGQYTHV
jgi:hypothetical protein